MNDLVIYGAGYPDVVKVVEAINSVSAQWRIRGFVDDTPGKQGSDFMGFPVLGGRSMVQDLCSQKNWFFNNVYATSRDRRRVAEIIDETEAPLATLVHPQVDLRHSTVGEGTIISPGGVIGAGSRIGRHAAVRINAVINHDNTIGDYVFVGPGVILCGHIEIGDGAYIGAGAVIKPRIRIGPGSVIGAGAVVVKDVAAGTTVMGNPAG